MGSTDLSKCENCGAGLLSVSDICPQCGWLKNNHLPGHEDEKVENDSKSNETTEVTNKIFRPTGVRIIGSSYMVAGILMVLFAIVSSSLVVFSLVGSAMGTFGAIGTAPDMEALIGMDPTSISSLDDVYALNGATSQISNNMMSNYFGNMLDIEQMMAVLTTTFVYAGILGGIGMFMFAVGRGLLKGRKWARLFALLSAVVSMPTSIVFANTLDMLSIILTFIFSGLIIYYLTKPKIRDYFTQMSLQNSQK